MSPERVAVLVIRAWPAGDGATALRARITTTIDVDGGEEVVTTAASVEEILATVRGWLDALQATGPPHVGDRRSGE